MMPDIFHRNKVPLALFLISILALYALKPSFLFQENGKRRPFGLGYDRNYERRTLFDMTIMAVLLAMVLGSLT